MNDKPVFDPYGDAADNVVGFQGRKQLRVVPGMRRLAELPSIELVEGDIDLSATLGEEALIASKLPVFRREKLLVRPYSQQVPATNGRMTMSAGLDNMTVPGLIDMLSQAVGWCKRDGRRSGDGMKAVNPPKEVADIILSRAAMSKLPNIAGVITTPTLRPDGSLLLAPGYDATTRLFHMPDPTLNMTAIPAKPTRADADDALHLLSSLLREFPFVGETDRAVALSAILTAVVRGALSVAPMHAFRASTAGSGKSFLGDVTSMIATGRPCPVMAIAEDEKETEKRIAGMLLSGAPLISLDNVNGELGGDLLCQAIERPLVQVRALGGSKVHEIESRATWIANGNSLRVRGDMTRRTLLCNLDAGMERPELREFTGNPVEDVARDRGKYVAACLTIMLAYKEAGRPNDLAAIASFDEWHGWVRGALVWLGCDDPVQSMETARDNDPVLAELREMIGLWSGSVGVGHGAIKTVSEIDQFSQMREASGEPGQYHLAHPEFRDTLLRIAGDRNVLNSRKLGNWLAAREGRIADGMRFEKAGLNRNKVMQWYVTMA